MTTRDSLKFQMKKKKKIIAGCCFLAIVFFITFLKGGSIFQRDEDILIQEGYEEMEQERGQAQEGRAEAGMKGAGTENTAVPTPSIVIDIAGAVSRPGILFLPEGSRVYEAVSAAGGVRPESDLRDINLAQELLDGEKIYIPSGSDYGGTLGDEGATVSDGGNESADRAFRKNSVRKININTASSRELQTLKGVGPSMAERILEYRKEKGRFQNISDLKNVKGMGEKTFEKLKDSISVT